MDKPSIYVKELLLNYPTMYKNRSDVLYASLIRRSDGWTDDGCLSRESGLLAPDAAIARNRTKFTEKIGKYSEEAIKYGREPLQEYTVLQAMYDLQRYEFTVANIDVIASSIHWYETDSHRITRHQLASMERYFPDYGPIFNPPDNIDPEWQDAIYEWVRELLPTMRGLWGMTTEEGNWEPNKTISGSACRLWHLLHKWAKQYISPANLEAERALSKIISEVLEDRG